LIEKHRKPFWIDVHQLRAWRSGNFIHIDLHLVLPQQLSLEKAHGEAKILEQLLIHFFEGNAGVLVHLDPCEAEDCPVCQQYDCSVRQAPTLSAGNWDRESLTMNKSNLHKSNGIEE
jgi:hypothetical protein